MTNPNRSIPPGIRDAARRVVTNQAIGDKVTYTQYSTETSDGRSFKIRCIVKPGGGVPLHYHRNCTEHFRVLRGVLTAVNGRSTLALKEGEETLIPANTDHLFRNDSEEECEFEGTVSERAQLFLLFLLSSVLVSA
jgi:mannose-6-phosphate isomerase-like protein (cupin superfamily)